MRRLIATACLFICCSDTFAWGDKGHRVIALIAWHYLAPATRAQIDALLQSDNSYLVGTDFASEASWADAYRDSDRGATQARYEQTRRWHYVNLHIAHPDLTRACYGSPALRPQQKASEGPANACVVDKVEQFAAELKDPTTTPIERLRALQFLIHLVGDLHQPLHASDNDDGGGNEVLVTAKGLKRGTLHGYWDNAMVSRLGRKPETIARTLLAQMNQSDLERWQHGTPRGWTLEAFAMARDVAYRKLPSADENGVYALDENYATLAKASVTQQLMKGGVRLAKLLEQSLPTP